MATIKSQMTLNDGMSSVLKKITRALDITLASFEQVQQVSGKAVDTRLIEEGRGLIVESVRDIERMEEAYRRAAREEEKLNQGIKQGTSEMDGLLGKVASVAAAYASISKVKDFSMDAIGVADVQIGAQVQLKTVMGNMGSLDYYDQILDKASSIQGKGVYGDEIMIAGAAELATYFSDADAVMSMMDTLTDYAMGMNALDGKGLELDSASMVQYATNLGKIMTGTYTAMSQKGFEFTDVQKAIIEGSANQAQIAAELGAEYLNMSADMQAAAVIGNIIGENWDGLYEIMSNTPEGKLVQLNNTLGDIQETIGAGIYPAVLNFVGVLQSSTLQIEAAAAGLATVLGFAITILADMTEGAVFFGTAVVDNWGWISPIVWGVVAALIAYNAVQGIGWLTTLKDIAAKGAHAVASAAETVAILALIAAQDGLNAAMAACPVTWIIVGIIALITVIVAVVRAFDLWGAQSTGVIGTICGLVAVAAAFIGNIAIGAVNLIFGAAATLWNFIANIANALAGIFVNPVGAIVRLFVGLADTVLSLLQAVASGLDALFGSNLTGAIQGWRDGLNGLVTETYGAGVEVIPALRDEDWKSGRFEYGGAFNAGAAFGDGISNQIGGFFGGFGYEPGSMDDLMEKYGNIPSYLKDPLDGLGNDVGTIADNTGGMVDSLEISGEELKYLRDIAERDAINRFTTAEVKIDMTGMTNKIDSGMDLDGIIGQLTDGFSEALVTAAEGVYE